jgi:hypothetical protein
MGLPPPPEACVEPWSFLRPARFVTAYDCVSLDHDEMDELKDLPTMLACPGSIPVVQIVSSYSEERALQNCINSGLLAQGVLYIEPQKTRILAEEFETRKIFYVNNQILDTGSLCSGVDACILAQAIGSTGRRPK